MAVLWKRKNISEVSKRALQKEMQVCSWQAAHKEKPTIVRWIYTGASNPILF